ncbi:hypothetical protein BGZ96_006770 [Linnemannia gamsii]|uniref:Galactose oxidase n=1 Tax=Linnemannia gamsii TaxID=64522 RepID=A0ABQ7K4A3_9FUNG|nr:hypothetical protein BGZ96_006770 [Linnemannia gamsii]
MWEYKSGNWGSLNMINPPFTDVVDHCMVPAMGGASMIMFGGQRPTATSYQVISGIYILDTATMAWKAGTAAPAQEARRGMACTVSGDYFIAWGGTNGTVMGAKPLVYNMQTNQWVDQFVVPLPSGATTGGSNIGAIAGGAGGAVVLIAIVLGFVFYRHRQQRKAKETDEGETKDKELEKEGLKAGKKPGNDLKKDPQGNNMNNNLLGEDEGTMVVDRDGRVIPRNPQTFIHTTSGGFRNPQYKSGVYPPSTSSMYQNNPQYFEPGTQYQDMQFYTTVANNPQLYASSPYAMGVSGGVQSHDFSYPPVPPLAAMRRDSQARMMSGITGSTENIGGAAAPMTEEILNLQIALVKAQQEQQFQLQQQNLARFRAEQEAQLLMLQQQLRATSSSSSPSMTNALSAPVPSVSPWMSPSSSSMSAPVPIVGSEPPSSSLSSPLSTATIAAVETVSKTDSPMVDYVPAPVFAPTPASSSATSEATTFVASAPVSTVTSPDSDDTFVKPSSVVSAPIVTRFAPST